jgi:hypothetical protein
LVIVSILTAGIVASLIRAKRMKTKENINLEI